MNRKFYTFLKNDSSKQLLSLNFLMSEKIVTDDYVSAIDFKGNQKKATSDVHSNAEFFCLLYHKHISRCISNIGEYDFEQL